MTTSTLNSKNDPMKAVLNALMVILVMFAFLVSLKMMGDAFKLFGKDTAHDIINATANPFVALFIGLLATAIIQSSSTTTSMIVAMVAAGTITIENAVPMIMGANIGTSVTSTFVSLGFIGSKKEYRKAISAATVHDFFNIMVVLLLFPLEYMFGFLSGLAGNVASLFTASSGESEKMFSILGVTVKPVAKFIVELLNKNAWATLVVALGLLFFSLRYLTIILKKMLIGKAEKKLDKLVFSNPMRALGWGTLLTAVVQSSSVTSSLIVPMVAANKVSLRKAFPFLMGANIGTTLTALIAALSTEADVFQAALTIALAHVLFNVLGAMIVFPIKRLREIPIKLSRKLGKATMKNRLVGMAYIVVTFFLIPFLLILVSSNKTTIIQYNFTTKEVVSNKQGFMIYEDELKKGEPGVTRSVYFLDKMEDFDAAEATHSFHVHREENIINIGQNVYITSPIGYCFDREELKGKVRLCIADVLLNYEVNDVKLDTCYIYSKTYDQPELVDSIYEKEYLDIKKMMVVKKEVFDKTGKLIELTTLN